MIQEFQTADTEQVMQIWLNGNEDAHPFISKLSEELDEAKGGTEYTMIRNEKWNNSLSFTNTTNVGGFVLACVI